MPAIHVLVAGSDSQPCHECKLFAFVTGPFGRRRDPRGGSRLEEQPLPDSRKA